MIKHCRLPLGFDPQLLAADLQRLCARPWVRHFVSQNYRGDWSALALRSASGREDDIHAHPVPQDAHADTPALRECAYLQQALAGLECPLGAVRLMKLGAASEILEHRDPGCGYEFGELRLHVPITTSPEVEFFLDGERVPMGAGECWYLNFSLPHRVVNAGAHDRVHLVIDCALNEKLDRLFLGLGFSAIERYGTKARLLENNIEGLRQLGTPQALAALETLLAQKAEIESARRARHASTGQFPR